MNINRLKKNKNFSLIVGEVINKSSTQKKKIYKFLNHVDDLYYKRAENFSKNFFKYLKKEEIDFSYAINAYLKMCLDMMVSHKFFLKNNRYPVKNEKQAYKNVYNNMVEMKSYMIGLAISQFLWPTHYAMYSFFNDKITKEGKKIKNYLEVGPGHGLFFLAALEKLHFKTNFEIVDISKTSIKITESIVNLLSKNKKKIKYNLKNVIDTKNSQTFDFITMGEVLEHVADPKKLLHKLNNLLSKNGTAYISTCVDCPSIDHIYHFKSISEIENMICGCGFKILDKKVLPVEDKPMKEIIRNKITINYCAHIKKISN